MFSVKPDALIIGGDKKKCLVLLAGCGLGDGSQIEEVILTYLMLDKYKIEYQLIAIDMDITCFNHFTIMGEKPTSSGVGWID